MSEAYRCDGCGEFNSGKSFGSAELCELQGCDEFEDLCGNCCRDVREVLEQES